MTPATDLMIALEQIELPTNLTCVFCRLPAVVTLATVADPDPEPACGLCAAAFLETTAKVLTTLGRPVAT